MAGSRHGMKARRQPERPDRFQFCNESDQPETRVRQKAGELRLLCLSAGRVVALGADLAVHPRVGRRIPLPAGPGFLRGNLDPIGCGAAGFVSISPLLRDLPSKPRRRDVSDLPFPLPQSNAVRAPPDQPDEKDFGRKRRGSLHRRRRPGSRGGTGTPERSHHLRGRPLHGRHDGEGHRTPAVRARLPGGLEPVRRRPLAGQSLRERPQSLPAGLPGPGGSQ